MRHFERVVSSQFQHEPVGPAHDSLVKRDRVVRHFAGDDRSWAGLRAEILLPQHPEESKIVSSLFERDCRFLETYFVAFAHITKRIYCMNFSSGRKTSST